MRHDRSIDRPQHLDTRVFEVPAQAAAIGAEPAHHLASAPSLVARADRRARDRAEVFAKLAKVRKDQLAALARVEPNRSALPISGHARGLPGVGATEEQV